MTIYISNGVYITNIILALQWDRLSLFAAKTTVVFPFLLPKEQGSDTSSSSKTTCDNPGCPKTLALSQQCW